MKTPEEIYEEELRDILRRIKLESLRSVGEITVFRINRFDEKFDFREECESEVKLLEKLESLGAIKIKESKTGPEENYETYEEFDLSVIQTKFDEIYQKYNGQLDESKNSKKPSPSESNPTNIQYFLKFENGVLVLNDQWIMRKPDFNSENYNFIESIIKTPRKMDLAEFEKTIGGKPKKDFHKILDGLGFKSELKKIFFPSISKNAVEFKNFLTQEDLKNININEKRLKNHTKGLRKVK